MAQGARRGRLVLAVAALVVVGGAWATRGVGMTARREPWPGEAGLARWVRAWTLPARFRGLSNPLAETPETIRAGMEHWADHCATCHGNDGKGRVPVGRGLFPPAPDMTAAGTQNLSDGALFYAIEEGIPFTGMPAWGTGTSEGERASWELVHFIRYLPGITPDELGEMDDLNPRSAAEIEAERSIDAFLSGE